MTIRVNSLFSPVAIVLLVYTPVLLLYVFTSESVFLAELGSLKRFSSSGLLYFVLSLLLLATGAAIGQRAGVEGRHLPPQAGSGPDPLEGLGDIRRRVVRILEAALLLSILAYVLWFALGITRAGGVGGFLSTWLSNPHYVKSNLLATLPGITTLTQLAVAAVPLVIAFKLFRSSSFLRKLVVLVFVLAAVRAVFYAERLALLELVIPLAFLAFASRKVIVRKAVVYATVLVVATIGLFIATELRRTYVYTQDFSLERGTTRFFGYYLTSVNNGFVVVDHYPSSTPFYSLGQSLWLSPGLGGMKLEHLPQIGTISLRYADLFGVEPQAFWDGVFWDEGLDTEFNVLSGPGYLAADLGWLGLLAVFILGIASGAIYRRTSFSTFYAALYGVWLVGLLEFMRIMYFSNTRLLPAYLVFGAVFLVLRKEALLSGARKGSAVMASGTPSRSGLSPRRRRV